jgi:hypothetical protein
MYSGKVFGADLVIAANDAALEERPEVLNRVAARPFGQCACVRAATSAGNGCLVKNNRN